MARIRLLSRAEAGASEHAFYDRVEDWLRSMPGPRGNRPVPQPWRAAANAPGFAEAFFAALRYLLTDSDFLNAHMRWRQIIILTIARRRMCPFVWRGHKELTLMSGLDEQQWEALLFGRPSIQGGFSSDDLLAVRFAARMAMQSDAGGKTVAAVRDRFGDRGLAEFTALGSCFLALCAWLSTLAIEDDPLDERPDPHISRMKS